MKIFTIRGGCAFAGALVEVRVLRDGADIPAIVVGAGRGVSILPIHLTNEQYAEWKKRGRVVAHCATIGITRSGRPKLFARDLPSTDESIICVFRTHIGMRGGNEYTGDCVGATCDYGTAFTQTFAPFPGHVLASGRITYGSGGRLGSGTQIIATLPQCVFRTAYTGKLMYPPKEHEHYYRWDGVYLHNKLHHNPPLS